MAELPRAFRQFRKDHPAVVAAYEALGEACAGDGPLDAKGRALVRLAVAVGARLEGAVRAHARRAREAGATAAELRHVLALAVPTVGFPTAVAASTWIATPRRLARPASRSRPR